MKYLFSILLLSIALISKSQIIDGLTIKGSHNEIRSGHIKMYSGINNLQLYSSDTLLRYQTKQIVIELKNDTLIIPYYPIQYKFLRIGERIYKIEAPTLKEVEFNKIMTLSSIDNGILRF